MKTSDMGGVLEAYIKKLLNLFLERNQTYAEEIDALANFKRNAELTRVFRLDRIITRPYGSSLKYVIEKIDRLINETIHHQEGRPVSPHFEDHIDDAIVYLFITKQALKEEGII